jgi:hypothetical protein
MPRHKKHVKGRRKSKKFVRRLRRGNRRTRGARIKTTKAGFLLGDRLKVKLAYTDFYDSTTDANGVYTYTYTGNSPYDPDVTGLGIQPTGWDQYSNLYRFYYCSGSKITATVVNKNSSNSIRWGVSTGTNVLSAADLAVMDPTEWPYTKWRTLGPSTTSKSVGTVKNYLSTKKVYGYKAATNTNFIASVAGPNPTNLWYWNVFIANPALTATTFTISLKIVYYVIFFQRPEIGIS